MIDNHLICHQTEETLNEKNLCGLSFPHHLSIVFYFGLLAWILYHVCVCHFTIPDRALVPYDNFL